MHNNFSILFVRDNKMDRTTNQKTYSKAIKKALSVKKAPGVGSGRLELPTHGFSVRCSTN